jgi:L-ascorbate metabolism protein UlaG (beta-lactamase superfamily)
VELVNTAGRHIYIDVWDVTSLTKEPSSEDILLTTHKHMDHYDIGMVETFPGQKIITAVGEIQLSDVKITAIASAHNATDPIQAEGATNYIFIIEMDGLRIAHFGDIGQEALTEEQLVKIGAVDLAITQLSNSYSVMNAANRKGINLMNQVKPRLIIPTHTDQEALGIAVGLWKGFYSESRTVTLRPDTLPSETSILVLGGPGIVLSYATIFNLEVWK